MLISVFEPTMNSSLLKRSEVWKLKYSWHNKKENPQTCIFLLSSQSPHRAVSESLGQFPCCLCCKHYYTTTSDAQNEIEPRLIVANTNLQLANQPQNKSRKSEKSRSKNPQNKKDIRTSIAAHKNLIAATCHSRQSTKRALINKLEK